MEIQVNILTATNKKIKVKDENFHIKFQVNHT